MHLTFLHGLLMCADKLFLDADFAPIHCTCVDDADDGIHTKAFISSQSIKSKVINRNFLHCSM